MEIRPESDQTVKQNEVKALRVQIDACIKESIRLSAVIGRGAGGRELSLVTTKLQEGKMWAGKILEELGSELPAQYRDEAKLQL